MKFGITKEVIYTKTNINGKPLYTIAQWKVYRSLCFGLMKIYLHISSRTAWKWSAEVVVEYVCKSKATSFETEQEAESLIKEIENNPDKFVIYK